MKRILGLILCAAALVAQEPVSRVLMMKYINPERAIPVLCVLAGKQVRWQADSQMKLIVMSGPGELVKALEEAIQKLDVPPPVEKNVELTFHLLLGTAQAESISVPPDLGGVATQLRSVFGFKSVRVLETSVLRGREGRQLEAKGLVPTSSKLAETAPYGISVKSVAVNAGEKGAAIRLDGLRFNAQFPIGTPSAIQFQPVGISTDLDVREGQKVVVGKASIDGASQSIFLVVTAKVVD
jgi:hypothetical protein